MASASLPSHLTSAYASVFNYFVLKGLVFFVDCCLFCGVFLFVCLFCFIFVLFFSACSGQHSVIFPGKENIKILIYFIFPFLIFFCMNYLKKKKTTKNLLLTI